MRPVGTGLAPAPAVPRAMRGCLRTAAAALTVAVLAGALGSVSPEPWRHLFAAIGMVDLGAALVLLLSVLLVRCRSGRRR